jgi:hypothetical protein
MSTGENAHQLSEQQELLLSRYYDGEISIIDRVRAKRLLRTNAGAAEFFAELQSLTSHAQATATNTATTTTTKPPCDLWERISARIDSEEKAALYLGKRPSVAAPEREGFIASILSSHTLVGGFSGAAVAAALLLLFSPLSSSKNIPIITVNSSTTTNGSSVFKQVGLENEGASLSRHTQPATPMELDWMRANGTLRLIPSPHSPAGIIWINRYKHAKATVSPAPSPLGKTAQRKRVDVTTPNRSE